MSWWAFLVGINGYRHLTRLEYAVPDVEALGDSLVSNLGFAPERIIRMTCQMKGENHADAAGIEDRLMWLIRQLQPDDTLVFAFSGHGFLLPDGSAFLAAVDTRQSDDPYVLSRSSVSLEVVQKRLQQAAAAQTFVILDCCREDPAPGKSLGGGCLASGMVEAVEAFTRNIIVRPTRRRQQDRAFATLFACSPGEKACEWKDRGHGVFWSYLLEGLSGPGAEADGRFTAHSLAHYVYDRVPSKVDELYHRPQHPRFYQAEGAPVLELGRRRVVATPPASELHRVISGLQTRSLQHLKTVIAGLRDRRRQLEAEPESDENGGQPSSTPLVRKDRPTPVDDIPKKQPPIVHEEVGSDATVRAAVEKAVEEIKTHRSMGSLIDENSALIWRKLHDACQGREIPELCDILADTDRKPLQCWKAITLLRRSICTSAGQPNAAAALEAIRTYPSRGGFVQRAALELIKASPGEPSEKYKLLFTELKLADDKFAGPIMKALVQWAFESDQREQAGREIIEILERTTKTVTIVGALDAIEQLGYRQAIPRLRRMLSNSYLDKAWHLARSLANFGDRESAGVIRDVIDRFRDGASTNVCDLVRNLYQLEGIACGDYVAKTLMEASPKVQSSLLRGTLRKMNEKAILDAAGTLTTGSTHADVRQKAEEYLAYMKGSGARTRGT